MNAKQSQLINTLPDVASIPTTSGKKGDIPIFDAEVLPKKVITALDKYLTAVTDIKQAEIEVAEHKPVVTEAATKLLNDLCESGNFSKSVKLAGNLGQVTVSRMDKFSIPKDVTIADLENAFGKDFVAENFETEQEVLLNPTVLKDNKLLKELIDLVGKANFGKFFMQSKTIKAKPGLDAAIFKLPAAKRKEAVDGVIKQAAVSIK